MGINFKDIFTTQEWNELLQNLNQASQKVLEKLKSNNYFINTSPLRPNNVNNVELRFWDTTLPALLNQNGQGFIKIIETLADRFFPLKEDFISTIKHLIESLFLIDDFSNNIRLLRIQRATIREFILFLVSPSTKAVMKQEEEQLLSKIILAFKSSKYLVVSESTLQNLFQSSATKLDNKVQRLIKYLHLQEIKKSEIDPKTGNRITKIYYQFPSDIMELLKAYNILYKNDEGRYEFENDVIFDINLFSAIILAHFCSYERERLNKNLIIGITTQIALLFLLASQVSITEPFERYGNNRELMENQGFDSTMQIIPKSWVFDEIIEIYAIPLVKCVSYVVGGPAWMKYISAEIDSQIENQEKKSVINPADEINIRKLLKQLATRIPSVNQWKLGEKIRINIPILVDVENLLADLTAGVEKES
ncbi:MAG: hypothetical protein K9W44_04655 [Candidatus Lokiarchaeota archaeon]|nr:hypothetical protein [Candidatus Harpocratesius repetitus]